MTVRRLYPPRRIYGCIDSLGDAIFFSMLDANCGCWQMLVAQEDKDKTALFSNAGTYCFNRLPFGLKNAPATF